MATEKELDTAFKELVNHTLNGPLPGVPAKDGRPYKRYQELSGLSHEEISKKVAAEVKRRRG